MADASLQRAGLESTAARTPGAATPDAALGWQWQAAATAGGAAAAAAAASGSAVGSHSAMLAASVRRLEQRLESERRNTQRQVQRIERLLEESLNVPCSGGRWAELEGYVDGLAETVQELMRRAEDTGQGGSLQTPRTSEDAATFCNKVGQATGTNLQGARIVAAAVDRSQQRQCERMRQIEQLFEEYNDRLARAELQLIQHAVAPTSTISSLQTQLADVTARMGVLEVHRAQLDNTAMHTRALQDQPSSSPARAALAHTDPVLLASASSPNASPVRSVGASFCSPPRLLQTPSEMPSVGALQVLTARVDRVVEIVGEMDARILEYCESGPSGVAELDAWTAELGARISRMEQSQETKGTLERDIALMCEQMSVLQAQLRDGRGSRETSDTAGPLTADITNRKQVMRQLNFTCERVAELGEKVQEMEREMGSNVDASEMQAQLDHVFERTATQPAWPNGEDSEDSLCDENLSEKDGTGGGVRCEHWKAEHGAVSFVVHSPLERNDSVYKADGFMSWLAALWDPQRDTQEYANLQDMRHLCRRVNRLASRIQAAEQEVYACQSLPAEPLEGEGCSDSEAFSFKGRTSCLADSAVGPPGVLAEAGRHVHEQVEELAARMQDVEGNLQDMTELQEVRQQISRVGEQVLRLVVRLQTVENGSQALADRREMRTELSDLSEQFAGLESLESRVQDVECGLERMAEGFRRVCEEVAGLCKGSNVAEQSIRNESDEGCKAMDINEVDNLTILQERLPELEVIKELDGRLHELEHGLHGRPHVRQSLENLTKQGRELEVRVTEVASNTTDQIAEVARKVNSLEVTLLEELPVLKVSDSSPEVKGPADCVAEDPPALPDCRITLQALRGEIAGGSQEPLLEVAEHSDRQLASEESTSENEHLSRLLALEERTMSLHESFASFRGQEPHAKIAEHATRLDAMEESTANLHESFASLKHHEMQSEMAAHQSRLLALEESAANLHADFASLRSQDHLTRLDALEESTAKLHERHHEMQSDIAEHQTRLLALKESTANLNESFASSGNQESQSGQVEDLTRVQVEHLTRLDALEETTAKLNESFANSWHHEAQSELAEHQTRLLALEDSIANLHESFAELRASDPEPQREMSESLTRLHALEESTANLHESFASFRNQDAQGEMVEHLTRLFEKSTMDLHEKIESSRSRESESKVAEQQTRLSALEDSVAHAHEKIASSRNEELQTGVAESLNRLLAVEESTSSIHEKMENLKSKDEELLVSTRHEMQQLSASLQARIDSVTAESDALHGRLSDCKEESRTSVQQLGADLQKRVSTLDENILEQFSGHRACLDALEETLSNVQDEFSNFKSKELANIMSEHHFLLTALKTSMNDLHEKIEDHESKELPSKMLEHSTRMSTLEESFTLLHEKTLAFEHKERVDSLQEQVARLESKDPMEDISRHTAQINSLLEDAKKDAAGNVAELREQLQESTGRLREAEQCLAEMMDLEDVRQQWIHGMEESQAQLKDQICKVQESLDCNIAAASQARVLTVTPAVEAALKTQHDALANEVSPAPSNGALTGQLARTCLKVAACHEEVKLALAGGDVGLDKTMPEDQATLEACIPADDLGCVEDAGQELESQFGRLCESVTAFQSGVQSALQSQDIFVQGPSLRGQLANFNERLQQLEEHILHEPKALCNENLTRESGAEHFDIAGDHQDQLDDAHEDQVDVKEPRLAAWMEAPEAPVSPGRQTVDDLLMPRSAPLSARGAGIETALARSEGRLLSASLRLEAQVRSMTNTGRETPLTESTQADVERLAKDLEQATLSAARRANLETHRMEALQAVESRVTVVNDRIADICSRLDEAERGLEMSERNGAALVRRFERLESAVDAQVGDLAADLVSVQRAALERSRQLAAVSHQHMVSLPLKPVANSAAAAAL